MLKFLVWNKKKEQIFVPKFKQTVSRSRSSFKALVYGKW